MRWDIFCKVIDNHGDLGVCWRLASQLAGAGERVRLWVDDASALAWMAPHGRAGVAVIDWCDLIAVEAAVRDAAPDVVIEAFGCDPEPALLARFAAAPGPRSWINLEYLCAESYVERMHRLPSPVFHGPGAGLTKHFFYPGFTPATGGLLREPELEERRRTFDRAAWLADRGIAWQGERLVSLFCYEPPALGGLLARWSQAGEPTRLLVTAGRAAKAVRASVPEGLGALRIDYLPYLPQESFDELLWSCDLNLVRGEDSLVRALWAGAPLVWQIYPQDDDAHHDKLDAFLRTIAAPESLRRFHAAWNGIADAPIAAPSAAMLAEWRQTAEVATTALQRQPDLLTQLRAFVDSLRDRAG
ncbi:elongation factor P maturation arginine rhamnosyltransferase EarP [Xylophilus sp. GOD-11R]|uniref:elongation factor P maturation arginine rhamnosyltransferase EarP n=1 Tax=Xylophilus sp. GOD-11R TaxID=3089814 RepID=UPI00298C8900|nr:elongation factor P maturation arginine rhamnosyltransferase EarP [Xylophilus sp. GOD-11R]WPB58018.1 elongation factor P maturation arginine rhamnosyltransferase EarP [Xylophilus sp. GOD-11R]